MKAKVMLKSLFKFLLLGSSITLVACTSVGERTELSVAYYTVSGDTFSEVDKQIKLHGPEVTGVGKALASTDLRMLPSIKYELVKGGCRVTKARVNIKARVTQGNRMNKLSGDK